MEPTDRLVVEFGNAYKVALRHVAGEISYPILITTLVSWPYVEAAAADEETLDLDATPGSFAHVQWALRDNLISLDTYRRIAELGSAHYGMMHNVISVYDLTLESDGRWRVTTRDSTHIIDLDEGTVTRDPGPAATEWPDSDRAYKLRTLTQCRARETGRWTMHPRNELVDHHWTETSLISTIVRIDQDGPLI